MLKTSPIRGDFPSLKLGRMVHYGSTIERDYLYFLEYWQHVTWYREQPMTVEQQMPDGRMRSYTPDYEVHEVNSKTLVECKPLAKLESSHAQQQRFIGQSWADANDYQFITVTDAALRTGHQLANLQLFWRYARYANPVLQQQLITYLHRCDIFSVDQLQVDLQQPRGVLLPIMCHLLFHQQCQMDINLPFSASAKLWLNKEV